jgi:hypothetical protein
MTAEIKNKALEIIGIGIAKIVNNYSETALLINACFVSIDRYTNHRIQHLSTTQNIPEPLRLDNEIEVVYSNEDLIRKYRTDVQKIVFENYIISSVSLVDAILEDLYEYLLKSQNPNITDADLDKAIRNAWTKDNLLNFLTDANGIGLTKPNDKQTEFREAFMRYSELRILRHTILHSNGLLTDKNFQKLQDNFAATPVDRQHFALINAPLFQNKKIVLTVNDILSVRQYLDRFLMYIHQSIREK